MISVGVPYLKSAIAGLLACTLAVSIGIGYGTRSDAS
jgi:hypothetical protein